MGQINSIPEKNLPTASCFGCEDAPMKVTLPEKESKWDEEAQQYHGGQEWGNPGFVCDFSVTTNFLGAPKSAMQAARASLENIVHYPAADQEPARSELANFIWNGECEISDNVILGNGASELIDLIVRHCCHKNEKTVRPGPFDAQYKEYMRSAEAAGYNQIDRNDNSADLTCIVNPCNPTGDYLKLDEIKTFIETNVKEGSTVLVDESMHIWLGPNWRDDSLTSQIEWLDEMYNGPKKIAVYIIHSWTKIWCCPGIRLGSVVTPTKQLRKMLLTNQVPWSVNTMALDFLSACVKDERYLKETWEKTPIYRQHMIDWIKKNFPHWKCYGKSFLSWIWIDCGTYEEANAAYEIAKKHGVPIRPGTKGYKMHSCIRFGVREPHYFKSLANALKKLKEEKI